MCSVTSKITQDFNKLIKNMTQLQRSQLFGAALRLAFHDAGEINLSSADSLGPDGCLSLDPASGNQGLIELVEEPSAIMEPIWQKYCDKISRADFWVYFGKLVTEKAATAVVTVDFHYGRKDNIECSGGTGRLPDASLGLAEINRVFTTQMGLTLVDAVTLIGAHSVGHVSPARSGFGHPLTDSRNAQLDFNSWDRTPDKLDNSFFNALVNVRWDLDPATAAHKQDYIDKNTPTIMLNTDLTLGFVIDTVGNDQVPDQQACGGGGGAPPPAARHLRSTSPQSLSESDEAVQSSDAHRRLQQGPPCARQSSTQTVVDQYRASNSDFLNAFAKSYVKMVNVGYGYTTSSGTSTGKLGSLTLLTC